jgi:hypothetical protein
MADCQSVERRQRPKAPTREEKASLAEPKAMTTSPRSEADRAVEAMRWALPELLKLDRYERRAAIRRERALRVIRGDRGELDYWLNVGMKYAKRTQFLLGLAITSRSGDLMIVGSTNATT